MIKPSFDTRYLNRTENRGDRPLSAKYKAIVWHETANGSGNAHSTLNWNLAKKAGSSYDFLIGRDGTIYQYLDYHKYTSWDTGDSEWTIDGTLYKDWALNSITLGVELDGACDGTPVTLVQLQAAASLALFLHETEGIPLDRQHQLTHAEIAKHRTTNKRFDPRGYSPEQVIDRAVKLVSPDYDTLWGSHYDRFTGSGIELAWRPHAAILGHAVSNETGDARGHTWRLFEHGAIDWTPTSVDVYAGRGKL